MMPSTLAATTIGSPELSRVIRSASSRLIAERAFQHAGEFTLVALERCVLEPADQFAGDRHDAACRRVGDDIEIDQDQPAFVRKR